ncbi:hypothetical protein [Clostridium aquiflavi]|uniref:Uncharacterized protein n=1 Tax=Clostridium aquiflavi TaxID=3073603 RepID=A0ABU1EE07_9CLOT|nr:hypothetical protein [Clostridium sp. 5N-1]MDR5586608.1 hypothetical protein [Clostridium sp. 5N-1]
MQENKIKVYIKIDENNCIININSSIFLDDIKDYIQIDEGDGDKYSHAQGNYLEKGLINSKGRYNYKYVDNKVIELTEEEKEKLFPPVPVQPTPQELLNSKLLMDNANIQLELDNQKKLNADLLLKMAQLGGVTNV